MQTAAARAKERRKQEEEEREKEKERARRKADEIEARIKAATVEKERANQPDLDPEVTSCSQDFSNSSNNYSRTRRQSNLLKTLSRVSRHSRQMLLLIPLVLHISSRPMLRLVDRHPSKGCPVNLWTLLGRRIPGERRNLQRAPPRLQVPLQRSLILGEAEQVPRSLQPYANYKCQMLALYSVIYRPSFSKITPWTTEKSFKLSIFPTWADSPRTSKKLPSHLQINQAGYLLALLYDLCGQ
jgi:hypothetical protein